MPSRLRRRSGSTALPDAASIAAVAFLAIAVGVHALGFAFVYACLWKPLPFPDADRLVVLGENRDSQYSQPVPYARFVAWRDAADVFDGMSANGYGAVYIAGESTSALVRVEYVSAGFFGMLGTPLTGRDFVAAEDAPGAPRAAVVSHELWERLFGASRTPKERFVDVNGHPTAIVGITPPGFRFWRHADVYLPAGPRESGAACLSCGTVYVVARLERGVRLDAAQTQMNRLHAQQMGPFFHSSVAVRPYREFVTARLRPVAVMLFAASAGFLLIAGVHIVNLLCARRALLATGHTLTAGGAAGVLGSVVVVAGQSALNRALEPEWLPIGALTSYAAVPSYAVAVAMLSGAAIVLVTRLRVARRRLDVGEDDAERPRPLVLTRALLLIHVAAAVAITFGALTSAVSYHRAGGAQSGNAGSRVLTVTIREIPKEGSPSAAEEGVGAGVAAALDRIRTLPGIVSVAPLGGAAGSFAIETTGDASAFAASVRKVILATGRLAVYDLLPLTDVRSKVRRRAAAILAGVVLLALLAVVFTACGFYAAGAVVARLPSDGARSPARAARGLVTLAAVGAAAGTAATALLPGTTAGDWPALAWAAAISLATAGASVVAAVVAETERPEATAPSPEAACHSASA